MPLKSFCGCGCGRIVRGQYAVGHRPIKSYRFSGGTRLHQARAEKALGRPLPPGVVVHHAKGGKADDEQLVICPDQRYHALLHSRMRIKAAGGDPNTQGICSDCRCLKSHDEMTMKDRPYSGRCRACLRLRKALARAA